MKGNSIKTNPYPTSTYFPSRLFSTQITPLLDNIEPLIELRMNGTKLCSVNNSSSKALPPHHSVFELNNVMPQIIWQVAFAQDTSIPIPFSKKHPRPVLQNQPQMWLLEDGGQRKRKFKFSYILLP